MIAATRRVTLVVAVAAATGLAAAGCGGASSRTSASQTTSASSSSAPSAPPRRPRRLRPPGSAKPIGHSQAVKAGTSTLEVTVTRVLDPLRGSGAALPPGTRPVGVAITIHNRRGATYDSTASGDVSIVSSSGMAAPLFARRGACETPLTDFESLIGVGETHAGCVSFALPKAAKVVAVRFSPHSRRPGSVLWR